MMMRKGSWLRRIKANYSAPAAAIRATFDRGGGRASDLVNRLRERLRGKDGPSATRRVLPIFPADGGRRLGAGLGRSPGTARRSEGVRAAVGAGVDAPDNSLRRQPPTQMLSLSRFGTHDEHERDREGRESEQVR